MAHSEFLQDNTLQHTSQVGILLTKVGQPVRDIISPLDLLSYVKFPPKMCAVTYYFAETPNFPSSCPSLVYIADMHCIHKSNVPFIDQKNVI